MTLSSSNAPTAQETVFVVDDDPEILDLLGQFLGKHGYDIGTASGGAGLDRLLARKLPDIIILDLMMPGEDGLAITRRLRQGSTASIPIIMLTAMGEDVDRIVGLEMGADDYLPKPFNPRELLARIKSVVRRSHMLPPDRVLPQDAAISTTPRPMGSIVHAMRGQVAEAPPPVYTFGGLYLDTGRRALTNLNGTELDLSAGEYDLLLVMVERPQRVLSRDQLLDLAKGRHAMPFDRAIDIQISRLRKKLEKAGLDGSAIKTVRGGGYMLTLAVAQQ
jgi:DNA-binding response OmpR family regulator